MNKKLIVAVLALGLFVPAGGRALAGFAPLSDLLIFGSVAIPIPEDVPGVPQVVLVPNVQLPPGFAVQLYEDTAFQVLSDQVYTVQNATGGTDLIARSDPDLITLSPNFELLHVVETGGSQDFSSFFHGQVGFQSDLNVPEPATLALLATGALPLLVARRLRSQRSRLLAARV